MPRHRISPAPDPAGLLQPPSMAPTSALKAGWKFSNSYAALPEVFFVRQHPVPVRAPRLVILNLALTEELGLDPAALSAPDAAALFAGNLVPAAAEPIAQAYAGHQFGHFTMLGDGRAILLGEHLAPGGRRVDVQLKGSGITPFSRRGDGRAALGPMLREYIVSEAMHALGIPTTRSLAVTATGEAVYREDTLAGATLTRIAASHIRIGTFEYAAALGRPEALRALADYTLRRHYPEALEAANPPLALLSAVVERQAALVAGWMLVGFVHGVMNTDNMALAGETMDYGPCAFMDTYHPATVFSSIDDQGRYAYINQPAIAQWNLARFAETLLPLLHADPSTALALAEAEVAGFTGRFETHWLSGMRSKLGLFNAEPEDIALMEALLGWMQRRQADYTATLRALTETGTVPETLVDDEFAAWQARWQARLARQAEPRAAAQALMRARNPALIPRNHLVEEALAAATQAGDFAVAGRLLDALARPYDDLPPDSPYHQPPPAAFRHYRTFCGT